MQIFGKHDAVGLLETFWCKVLPFLRPILSLHSSVLFSRTSSIAERYRILGTLLRNPFRRRWRSWYFSCTCSEWSCCKRDCGGKKTFGSTCPASFEIFVERREIITYITGWRFGTFFIFPYILETIIPTD